METPIRRIDRGARWLESALAVLAVAGALALLVPRLAAPFGGYHGWNEAWYAAAAREVAAGHALVAPSLGGVLPGFWWLLAAAFKLAGPSEQTARVVCLLAYLAAVWQTGRLAGVLGAHVPTAVALSASMPVYLVLGQNVQTECLWVALALAWWCAVVAATMRPAGVPWGAGVLAAVGWFVKPFVLLYWGAAAFAAVLETRGVAWLKSRRLWQGVAVALACLAPYYVYVWLAVPRGLSAGLAVGPAHTVGLPSAARLHALALDTMWGLGPGVALAGLAGLGLLLARREPAAWSLLGIVLANAAFFAVLNYHTYYVFGIAPAFAVAAACGLKGWRGRNRVALVGVLVAWGLAYGGVLLATKEDGQTAFADAARWIATQAPGGARVVMSERVWGTHGPVILYYAPAAAVETIVEGGGPGGTGDTVYYPPSAERIGQAPTARADALPIYRIEAAGAAHRGRVHVVYQERIVVRFGGRAYLLEPANVHVFAPPALVPVPDAPPAGPPVSRTRVPWAEVRELRPGGGA